VVSALILIRCVFRLIEFAQGNAGYLISHEVYMYLLDTTMMFLVMVVMNIFHPSIALGPTPVEDPQAHALSDRV
jgi:hypothetical protein